MSLLLDEPPAARGAQRPRICTVPEFATQSAGQEAIELAQLAGLDLDEWQQYVLLASLAERADGKWAAPTVCLICPRQNGKNSILEARELAGLYLFGEEVIVHSAHEQATASEQFRRVLGLIENTPELAKRMLKPIRGKGSEAIEMRNGQRILFKSRTGGSIRGFSVDLVVFDESYNLPETAISAMVPTKSARPNVQTIYTSSAVDCQKHLHATALTRQRDRGIKGSPNIAYFEWSAEGDDPSTVPPEVAGDPEVWAMANPGFGYRITEETIALEYDGDMGPREFAVERLGVGDWPLPESEDRIIPRAEWLACADENSRPLGVAAFGIDSDPNHRWASIAVAADRDDDLAHVEVVDRRMGVKWLVEACQDIQKHNPGAPFVLDDRGPLAPMIPVLEEAGIKVTPIDTRGYVWACVQFVDAVSHGTVRFIPPEADLDDAMAGATARPVGDSWAWSRKNSTVDISPLVAVTLALWGLNACREKDPQILSLADFLDDDWRNEED